mgnify:CR=1 FL=1
MKDGGAYSLCLSLRFVILFVRKITCQLIETILDFRFRYCLRCMFYQLEKSS